MTRTLRAYNKRPLLLGPGYRGWIVSNRIPEQNLFKYTIRDYHPWKQWERMEVIEGLFGDYLAERALAGLPVKGIY